MRDTCLVGILILAAATGSGNEFPIQVQDGRPLVDGVYVAGRGPYRFLLDTGAQSNQLDEGLAREIGLRPEFRVELETVAGVGWAVGASGVALRLGEVSASTEVLFTNMSTVREWSKGVRGVLGQAFLARFDYLLDLRERRLVFGSQSMVGIRAEMDITAGRPAVFSSLGMLVIDSGTDRLVLFGKGKARGPILRTANGRTREGGTVETRLFIEAEEINAGRAVRVTRPEGSSGYDGLLPACAFRAIYFCHSRGYVVLMA